MGNELKEKNLKEWDELLNNIFQGLIPESRTWSDKKDIIKILQSIGGKPNINKTFFPDGGGIELKGAAQCAETDCIELRFLEKHPCILKPGELNFQSSGIYNEWAYFRLDAQELAPSGWNQDLKGIKEELIELHPAEYIHRCFWDSGSYEMDETGRELPLPREARLVFRYISGSFVIFAGDSAYNETAQVNDGRHSKMTEVEFRTYISEIAGKPVK